MKFYSNRLDAKEHRNQTSDRTFLEHVDTVWNKRHIIKINQKDPMVFTPTLIHGKAGTVDVTLKKNFE